MLIIAHTTHEQFEEMKFVNFNCTYMTLRIIERSFYLMYNGLKVVLWDPMWYWSQFEDSIDY